MKSNQISKTTDVSHSSAIECELGDYANSNLFKENNMTNQNLTQSVNDSLTENQHSLKLENRDFSLGACYE